MPQPIRAPARPVAAAIARALEAEGYDVWWDTELPPHRPYARVIEAEIEKAKAVVVIWSADAAESQWVCAEAELARQQQKLVQTAIEAPRWLYGRNWGEEYSGLRLEGRFGQVAVEALQARGHERVSLVGEWDELMGHAQAIRVLPDALEAGFDPRGDGAALGF